MKIILNKLFLKINFFTIFCSQWLPAHPQHARIHHADLRRTAKEWLPGTTCSTISGGSGSGSGHSDSNSYGNSEYGSTSGAAESTTSARYANGNGEPVWSSDAGKRFSPPFTMNVVYSLICLCTSVDCNFFLKSPIPPKNLSGMGTQWLSGRVLDSRPRGRGFAPHRRHCVVVLEQDTLA